MSMDSTRPARSGEAMFFEKMRFETASLEKTGMF
jgi:hypothetical protein